MPQRRSDASAAETTSEPNLTKDSDESLRPNELRSVTDDAKSGVTATSDTTQSTQVNTLQATVDAMSKRLEKLERRTTRSRLLAIVLVLGLVFFGVDYLFPDGVVVQQTLMESTEVKLVDNDGNARLFLRMFARVPVLQILGDNGTPRMSLGLRFDSTPFIDLSDKNGRTRATFEMTEDDTPLIQFYDESGNRTTRLN